jgi:hypothetical protein
MISVGLVEGQALSVRHGDAVACELPLEELGEGWRRTIPRIVDGSRDPS